MIFRSKKINCRSW